MSAVGVGRAAETFVAFMTAGNTAGSWSEQVGAELGPYRLVERIGEGGMGVVYRAEQQVGAVKREVAVKIVKAGMHTGRVVALFERERQALALMDHPGIARVFDAGATASGRPFFAMELVRGVPIHEYCDERKLAIADRLRLFVEVCKPVQHAHLKGVIHRDLKPGNILVAEVDGAPAPKIIDFGIARAVENAHDEWEAITRAGELVGTLEYMSPEQTRAGQRDVDTRSDVYSLGVVLFELLSGAPPISSDSLRDRSLHENVQRICEEDAPLCSRRVAADKANALATAELRSTTAKRLQAELRGDLDAVVAKALDKDRDRRYETVEAFAQDVNRYLNLETIHARPTTMRYRLGKLIRRHRAATVAILAFAILLTGTATVSFGLAFWALNERREAKDAMRRLKHERRLAQDFHDLLLDGFQSIGPADRRADARIEQALDRVGESIVERFAHEPPALARQRMELARTLVRLGKSARAIPLLEAARETLADNEEMERVALDAGALLAEAYHANHRFDEGLKLAEEVWLGRQEAIGLADPSTLQALCDYARQLSELGRREEALARFREAEAALERALPADHPLRWTVALGIGQTLESLGKRSDARAYLDRALTGFADGKHMLNPDRWRAASATIAAAERSADWLTVRRFAAQFLPEFERRFGPDYESTTTLRRQWSVADVEVGDREKGLARQRQYLATRYPSVGAERDDVMIEILRTVEVQCRAGRHNDAADLLRDAAERLAKVGGPKAPNRYHLAIWRGAILLRLERFAEAEPALRIALEAAQERGEHSYFGKTRILRAQGELGDCLVGLGRFQEAEPLLRAALDDAEKEGLEAPALACWRVALGDCLIRQGKRDDAVRLVESARKTLSQAKSAGCWTSPVRLMARIDALLDKG